jgi:hypothetical protein
MGGHEATDGIEMDMGQQDLREGKTARGDARTEAEEKSACYRIKGTAASSGKEAHGRVADSRAEIKANVAGCLSCRGRIPEMIAGGSAGVGGGLVIMCGFVGADWHRDERIHVVAAVPAEGAGGGVVADSARAREKMRQFGDGCADAGAQEHQVELCGSSAALTCALCVDIAFGGRTIGAQRVAGLGRGRVSRDISSVATCRCFACAAVGGWSVGINGCIFGCIVRGRLFRGVGSGELLHFCIVCRRSCGGSGSNSRSFLSRWHQTTSICKRKT